MTLPIHTPSILQENFFGKNFVKATVFLKSWKEIFFSVRENFSFFHAVTKIYCPQKIFRENNQHYDLLGKRWFQGIFRYKNRDSKIMKFRILAKCAQCGNYGNLLSLFFAKNFVKLTVLLNKLLNTPMDISYLPRAYSPCNRGETGSLYWASWSFSQH